MSFSVGIIGLPNVGKSTLFSLLTKKEVPRENYPFCTIDPNVGIVEVPDERLEVLAKISRSEKIIPTVIEFVDIAGLVKGAHQGHGLGNKFLSHIREVDSIAQVVRAFGNPEVVHVDGRVDPAEDIEIINLELVMADLEIILRRIDEFEGKARSGDKDAKKNLDVFLKAKDILEKGEFLSKKEFGEDFKPLKSLNLLTIKPMFYVINVDLKEGPNDFNLNLPCPNVSLPLGKECDLKKFIALAYETLSLITFFTSGEKETRAWTVREGTKAQRAAGVIHSDFERGFIRAEVISWKDLADVGGMAQVKASGLLRLEGKEYVVRDGDVMHFRFHI